MVGDDFEKRLFLRETSSDTIIIPGKENVRKILKINLGDFLRRDMKEWEKKGLVSNDEVLRILGRYKQPVKSKSTVDYVPRVLYPLAGEILSDNGFVYNPDSLSWEY